MTDFDAKARECTADYRDRGAAWDAVERNIASALKSAFNTGIETAAHDLESKFKVRIRGRGIALYGTAEAIRAKKVQP